MKLWDKIKNLIKSVWALLVRFNKWSYKPIGLLLILVSTWYGFLKLVKTPPLDTTPVLIMVWITAGVLVLSLFPEILNRIKKIKVGDVEIELLESVVASVSQEYISLDDAQGAFDTRNKGGAKDLQSILARVLRYPQKPIVLIVNVQNRISKSFLFVYLFLLDMISDCESIFVIFIYSPSTPGALSLIEKDDVLGIITGKSALQLYYQKFEGLSEFWGQVAISSTGERYLIMDKVRVPSNNWIQSLNSFVAKTIDSSEKTRDDWSLLTLKDIKEWFWDSLSRKFVNNKIQDADIQIIEDAISQGDEVVIVVDDKRIKSLVLLNKLARNIAKKFLKETKKDT